MTDVIDSIAAGRIVPVVVLDDAADADPLADALLDGGLRCAEVTFRTDAAAEAIAAMAGAPGPAGRRRHGAHRRPRSTRPSRPARGSS